MERIQKPMQSLSDNPGSESSGLVPGENGDPGRAKGDLRRIATNAFVAHVNAIPLRIVMARYGYHINEQEKKTICPFHSKGRERSASFFWYTNTNTFFCWGCKRSGDVIGFVAQHDNISRIEAAESIMTYHGQETGMSLDVKNSIRENLKPIMEFSDAIRLFHQKYQWDQDAMVYVEKLLFSFDKLREKHHLVDDKLDAFIAKILARLDNY